MRDLSLRSSYQRYISQTRFVKLSKVGDRRRSVIQQYISLSLSLTCWRDLICYESFSLSIYIYVSSIPKYQIERRFVVLRELRKEETNIFALNLSWFEFREMRERYYTSRLLISWKPKFQVKCVPVKFRSSIVHLAHSNNSS